jgi:hypothetical protein
MSEPLGWAPLPPETTRAALAGGPVSQNSFHAEDISLAARDFQAEKLRRLFCSCETPPGEFETFGDDGRLAREHAEYFCEEHADVYGGALP